MQFKRTSQAADTLAVDALIVFVKNKKTLCPPDAQSAALLSQLVQEQQFKGNALQTAVYPTCGTLPVKRIILAGLGSAPAFEIETLERASAAAVRAGTKAGATHFAVAADDRPAWVRAVARGAAWGTYQFNTFKSERRESAAHSLTLSGASEACEKALKEAAAESKALCSTAELANLPGNQATPQKIADWASAMADETGLNYSVLTKADLEAQNCNALLAVAAGSDQDANVITLTYPGTDPDAKPVVLVGKTITFDSGGLSIKSSKGMEWMIYDKCGGMAVLCAMQMVARIQPKTPVVGILTVAENMPGGGAARPGDIIRARSGKTIEIISTDAEGRLALCDALDLALEHKPAALVDLATLTGAVIATLGHSASGVLGNHSELVQQLRRAAEAGGERLWELPLWQEHKDDIKGNFADIQNSCKSGTCGTITAGAFLNEFVPEKIPWAHIDIAGTAWTQTALPWTAPGATLAGARTLIEWIKTL